MFTLAQKILRHRKSLKTSNPPVVFCVRCGSTNLDQNSLTEIMCYDCENTIPWNGDLFSIRRGLDPSAESDVTDALEGAERRTAKARVN